MDAPNDQHVCAQQSWRVKSEEGQEQDTKGWEVWLVTVLQNSQPEIVHRRLGPEKMVGGIKARHVDEMGGCVSWATYVVTFDGSTSGGCVWTTLCALRITGPTIGNELEYTLLATGWPQSALQLLTVGLDTVDR